MGKVTTRIKVENWLDAELIKAGARKEGPRIVETDAVVDTGAVKLYLKSHRCETIACHIKGAVPRIEQFAAAETFRADVALMRFYSAAAKVMSRV